MIIVRSPLRITLGGGGTDLPSYYKKNNGFLISAAINKYVYIMVTKPFTKGIYLKYSESEKNLNAKHIKHPIFRETLKLYKKIDQIEITTLADIPSGTGLGSSGSFTTGLLKSLDTFINIKSTKRLIAEKAFMIEAKKLKSPIGKQDQYIASYGGLNEFYFRKNNKVDVKPLNLSKSVKYKLENNLLLFFTGFSRKANDILKDQDAKSKQNNKNIISNLDIVKEYGFQTKNALLSGDLDKFAKIMHKHWINKKQRSIKMSNSKIDTWYQIGINNGAMGGKVVGAGGGGFLMFYANNKAKLRKAMKKCGLNEVDFKFDNIGTHVIN